MYCLFEYLIFKKIHQLPKKSRKEIKTIFGTIEIFDIYIFYQKIWNTSATNTKVFNIRIIRSIDGKVIKLNTGICIDDMIATMSTIDLKACRQVKINTKRIGRRRRFVIGGDNRSTFATEARVTSEINKQDFKIKGIRRIDTISTSSIFEIFLNAIVTKFDTT